MLQTVLNVLRHIDKTPKIIAIDGPCLAGKSTFGAALQNALSPHAALLHMDDFFLPPDMRTQERLDAPGGNIHHERVLKEILLPLKARAKTLSYHVFDCAAGTSRLTETAVKPVVILEGSYALHPALLPHYDLKIFLDVSEQTQLARLQMRETPQKQAMFLHRWIPMEARYFSFFNIRSLCDLRFRNDNPLPQK